MQEGLRMRRVFAVLVLFLVWWGYGLGIRSARPVRRNAPRPRRQCCGGGARCTRPMRHLPRHQR